jgi:DNA polymerase III epsilon subunit-like protein
MLALFFDTETTGLPKYRNLPAHERKENWPQPVSISWIVTDGKVIVETKSYIIKPDGWTIPAESSKIHRITSAIAQEKGVSLLTVLREFQADLDRCGLYVAHNMEFDKNVMTAAALYWAPGATKIRWPAKEFCTMEGSRTICKIPWANPRPNDRYMCANLKRFYTHCFNVEPAAELLHTSLGDVQIMVACFFKCWKLEEV